MAEHTPAPWKLDPTQDAIFADHGIAPHICSVGTSHAFYHGTEVGEANARLICAAPELLAACKYVVQFLSDEYPQLTLKKRLDAAIAKAEGGAA